MKAMLEKLASASSVNPSTIDAALREVRSKLQQLASYFATADVATNTGGVRGGGMVVVVGSKVE